MLIFFYTCGVLYTCTINLFTLKDVVTGFLQVLGAYQLFHRDLLHEKVGFLRAERCSVFLGIISAAALIAALDTLRSNGWGKILLVLFLRNMLGVVVHNVFCSRRKDYIVAVDMVVVF